MVLQAKKIFVALACLDPHMASFFFFFFAENFGGKSDY